MRFHQLILTLGFAVIPVAGGWAGTDDGGAVGATTAPAVAAWLSISEETRCEAMRSEYCLGAFGFRVHADGSYETGYRPGATSHTAGSGQLAADDLAALKRAIADASPRASSWKATDADKHMPGMSDDVTLAFSDGHAQRVPATESGLRDLMKTLLKKYYPIPYTR